MAVHSLVSVRSRSSTSCSVKMWLLPSILLVVCSCTSLVIPSTSLKRHDRISCCQWQAANTGACWSLSRMHPSKLHSARRRNVSSFLSSRDNHNTPTDEQILTRYGFGSRIFTISNESLSKHPIPAEMYENGKWKLCLIVGLRNSTQQKTSDAGGQVKPPLLEVMVMNDEGLLMDEKVVDVGQITTAWTDFHTTHKIPSTQLKDTLQSTFQSSQQSLQNTILPIEKSMQNLYNNRIALRSRPPSHNRNTLTKKQIPKIASYSSNPQQFEELLRNLIKVGEDRISRMVDASLAGDYLYNDFCRGTEGIVRRMVAATVLTEDGVSGGRFKRRSCQFVSAEYSLDGDAIDDESTQVQQVILMNGGWAAVDPSVKAGTEGRKFASLAEDTTSSTQKKSRNDDSTPRVFTAADERVAHRLECLAMGDVWKEDGEGDEHRLELDVREALTRMNLPLTPDGATSALIRIGRWSESERDKSARKKALVEPWPPEVLDAARALVRYENQRREELAKECFSNKNADMEGRTNIASLPCVCIDAKSASFRDDSIGIRLRSSTGRKVNKAASKWEVLVHIADVSDLYVGKEMANENVVVPSRDGDGLDVDVLRRAAERRGQSRYDLPLGPLHLLPPVALEALSLSTNQEKVPNRCVTLWSYIDERDGKLLEAGLERTIISSPVALSFADATSLLERNVEDVPKEMANAKAVLSAAERKLSMWSNRHKQINTAAQQRESRLATREMIATELNDSRGMVRDDGVGGSFQRSRGHRLVDASLDLFSFAVGTLMKRAKHPIPRAAGSGADRGGRLGTAPLRRYIDGLAQRQALSVLCNYGIPLTHDECREAANTATQAGNEISNIRSSKASGPTRSPSHRDQYQISALHKLNRHLMSTGGINNQRQVKAISTGQNNEIVLEGVGVTARLKGVGNLVGGEKLLVQVTELDPEKGLINVRLAQTQKRSRNVR